MRKQATAEQKAKAAEKRSNMRSLAARISKMSEQERAELMARLPGVVTIEGRMLSLHNQFMLMFQMPAASVVGGFRQWKAAGRSVMKGQHGGCIWFPLGDHKQDGTEDTTKAGDDDEKSSCRFGLATVFDVSQTEDLATAEARRKTEAATLEPVAAPRPEPALSAVGDGGPDWSDLAYEDSCRETCGL